MSGPWTPEFTDEFGDAIPAPFPPPAPPFPPAPTPQQPYGFPPLYVYQEYSDDEDIQAFFRSTNDLGQVYVSWFADTPLAVYTNPEISGSLLDLVAAGIYGMVRPALSSGQNRDLGPFNTYHFNELPLNSRKLVGPANVTVTTDDVFKRILTWNFYKGDGNVFSIPWLKRRIMRFLLGEDGTAPNIDNTYKVSITYSPNQIAIRLAVGTRVVTGGALFNRHGFNQMRFNQLNSFFIAPPDPLPYETILKEAIDSGVLILPFQYKVTVVI